MRQFANYIKIAPAFRVASVTDGVVYMVLGYNEDLFPTENEIEPSEDVDQESPGSLYKIQVKATVDKLTDAQKRVYANNVPIIATLVDVETNDSVVIGNTDTPATITFVPGIVYDQLVIEYSSKTPVL